MHAVWEDLDCEPQSMVHMCKEQGSDAQSASIVCYHRDSPWAASILTSCVIILALQGKLAAAGHPESRPVHAALARLCHKRLVQ